MPVPVASVYASEQAGRPDHEMVVNVDLAQFQGSALERPFLAIWIEDKDKFPVRTLTVLYRDREARYLAELRAWYRADRLRAMAEGTDILGSVSSATRAPGRYTFKWDMKDQQGKLVKPGTYTVCIEAAREHGTYQMHAAADGDLAGADKQVTVPINGDRDHRRVARLPQGGRQVRMHAFKRRLAKYSRWLHIYVSMTSFVIVFFFAVTGWTLEPPRSVQRPRAAAQRRPARSTRSGPAAAPRRRRTTSPTPSAARTACTAPSPTSASTTTSCR